MQNEVIPRFDQYDRDGIIFDPIVPRAGQKITAYCTVVGLTPENIKSVSWNLERLNDGKVFFLAVNQKVFQFKSHMERLKAYHELNSKLWTLVFDPLDRDDIGNLTCAIADTGNKLVNITRFLDVHSEPIILESSTKDVEVNIGENVTLTCVSQGYPKPWVSWIRADQKPLPNGNAIEYVYTLISSFFKLLDFELTFRIIFKKNILRIKNVQKEDRGVYKCMSTNLIGSGSEWTVKLAVRCELILILIC